MPPKKIARTKPQKRIDVKQKETIAKKEEVKEKVPHYLEIKVSTIEKAGLGLFAIQNLQKDQIIGEYEGELISVTEADNRKDKNYQIFVEQGQKTNLGFVIDAKNAGNYTRFINHACFQDEQNVKFISDGHKVQIITIKEVKAGTELLIHYSRGMNLCLCFERYAIMYQTGQMKKCEFIDICIRQGIKESQYLELFDKLDQIRHENENKLK